MLRLPKIETILDTLNLVPEEEREEPGYMFQIPLPKGEGHVSVDYPTILQGSRHDLRAPRVTLVLKGIDDPKALRKAREWVYDLCETIAGEPDNDPCAFSLEVRYAHFEDDFPTLDMGDCVIRCSCTDSLS